MQAYRDINSFLVVPTETPIQNLGPLLDRACEAQHSIMAVYGP